ncbi:MAG: hypothetical protein IPG60_08945 [Bacteroidetes bacterium]|nr:hypothetical protein [Bacteroidota bacterium]
MKKKYNKIFIICTGTIVMVVVSFFQSCYYDNAEELLGTQVCDTAAVSFNLDVLPILLTNCATTGCHNEESHQSDIILNTYANVMASDVVISGLLVGAVDWLDGFSPMPENASQLPACDRALITSWVNQGALNN